MTAELREKARTYASGILREEIKYIQNQIGIIADRGGESDQYRKELHEEIESLNLAISMLSEDQQPEPIPIKTIDIRYRNEVGEYKYEWDLKGVPLTKLVSATTIMNILISNQNITDEQRIAMEKALASE